MERIVRHAFDWIALGLLAAIPAAIFWQSATSLADQDAASGGPMRNAALFPRGVAGVMVGLVLWQGLRLAAGGAAHPSPLRRAEGTGLAVLGAALFVATLWALPVIGFHLATPALGVLLFGLFGLHPVKVAAGGIGLSVAVAFVFEGLLNVVLPVGVWQIALFR